jgi:DME family drug/metabolite transporter
VALGLALIALAAASWGTTGATMKTLAENTPATPLLVGLARMAVAAPILVVAATALGRPWPRWRLLVPVALIAGGSMAGFQVGYFSAVPRVGVAVTALVAICSAPIMIAVLASVFLKEGLGPRVLLALAMGITGTTLLLIGPRGLGETGDRFLPGTLFALGAGLSYAIYAVTAKRVLAHVHPLQLAALTFGVAALVLSPTLAGQPEVGASVAGGWPLLLYLGLVPTALAYVLFNSGLRHTTATAASIVTLLEPFTATLLGVLLFDERLGVIGAVGAAILLAAIVTLALGSEQRAAAPLSG